MGKSNAIRGAGRERATIPLEKRGQIDQNWGKPSFGAKAEKERIFKKGTAGAYHAYHQGPIGLKCGRIGKDVNTSGRGKGEEHCWNFHCALPRKDAFYLAKLKNQAFTLYFKRAGVRMGAVGEGSGERKN